MDDILPTPTGGHQLIGMRVRLGGSRSVAIVVVFAFLLVHGSYAWCQSDDVHIPIRNESNVEGPDDPSLLTHSTFKAAVDVVLVPVAVTDAWNRPVLGLNSRDFELLEDGKYQKIQYFSAEQAPMMNISRSHFPIGRACWRSRLSLSTKWSGG
jgi:hypothetical protein